MIAVLKINFQLQLFEFSIHIYLFSVKFHYIYVWHAYI